MKLFLSSLFILLCVTTSLGSKAHFHDHDSIEVECLDCLLSASHSASDALESQPTAVIDSVVLYSTVFTALPVSRYLFDPSLYRYSRGPPIS